MAEKSEVFGLSSSKKDFLRSVNTFDDAVAKLLYSRTSMLPTYSKSELTELQNNYAGQTPSADYLSSWHLEISGLASGHDLQLSAAQLSSDFAHNEIISRRQRRKSDPHFVSLDLQSALRPQTLLATHHDGKLLELDHGAPLRLLAPMKLGLKNIKAITSIAYCDRA